MSGGTTPPGPNTVFAYRSNAATEAASSDCERGFRGEPLSDETARSGSRLRFRDGQLRHLDLREVLGARHRRALLAAIRRLPLRRVTRVCGARLQLRLLRLDGLVQRRHGVAQPRVNALRLKWNGRCCEFCDKKRSSGALRTPNSATSSRPAAALLAAVERAAAASAALSAESSSRSGVTTAAAAATSAAARSFSTFSPSARSWRRENSRWSAPGCIHRRTESGQRKSSSVLHKQRPAAFRSFSFRRRAPRTATRLRAAV